MTLLPLGDKMMTQDDIALYRDWVEDKSDYIISLYHDFGADVVRVQAKQRDLYERYYRGRSFFGDVEGEFLYLSMREMQPNVVVEIGAGCGWSTSWLLQGLYDNGHGLLTSCDIVAPIPTMPIELKKHLQFIPGDALAIDFPSRIDFLLCDSDHSAPYVYHLRDKLFPLVRPGGRICVHDVFAIATPAHAEAIGVYQWLHKTDQQCYTVGTGFPEQHARIQEARKAIGLGGDIHVNEGNSLAIVEVPE